MFKINPGSSRRCSGLSLFVCILAQGVALGLAAQVRADSASFAKEIDLGAFRLIAVQHDGRFKTFDTLARGITQQITGQTHLPREISGSSRPVNQDAAFTYLDLMFNPQSYADVRLLYVKKKPIRQALVQAAPSGSLDQSVRDAILKDGLVSSSFLLLPEILAKLQELSRDVMREAKEVDALMEAAQLADADVLRQLLRVIPPPNAVSVQEQWFSIDRLSSDMPADAAHAGLMKNASATIPGMDLAQQQSLTDQWKNLEKAWRAQDAVAASLALNSLAGGFTKVAPHVYPAQRKLALEQWYYRYNKMTWTWWFYMGAAVFLLMGIVYRWPRTRRMGVAFFSLAFALHTFACGIRWYLAGRIPNSNMFEAITAAAWFGAAVAIFFEMGPIMTRRRWVWRASSIGIVAGLSLWAGWLAVRHIPFDNWQDWGPVPTSALITAAIAIITMISITVAKRRGAGSGLTLLGACVVAMTALMCGHFMTVSLNSDISNSMPVLNDLWLYIHTNMIIASYALIGMAYVTAAIYTVGRLLTAPTGTLWLCLLIPAVVVPLPAFNSEISLTMVLPAWIPFLLVVVFAIIGHAIRLIGGRVLAGKSFAGWGGVPVAGVMSLSGTLPPPNHRPARSLDEDPARTGLGNTLDGATMLLMELSFITLWTGIIMGAIWADHSWGRPWGWDPKEVFALNTWIIFLILVHVRTKVRDKALWTAVLAVVGCSVMLFNWIVVNFFITGLHSYA